MTFQLAPALLLAVCAVLSTWSAPASTQQPFPSSMHAAPAATSETRLRTPHSATGRDRITLDEVRKSTTGDAYELVRKLRPVWLRGRGASSLLMEAPVLVYLQGMRYGGPESLRQISVASIGSIRFLSSADATTQFGAGHSSGAILVELRSR